MALEVVFFSFLYVFDMFGCQQLIGTSSREAPGERRAAARLNRVRALAGWNLSSLVSRYKVGIGGKGLG